MVAGQLRFRLVPQPAGDPGGPAPLPVLLPAAGHEHVEVAAGVLRRRPVGTRFRARKPNPEIFLTAARELGVEPRYAIVLEDARAGVNAAKAGGMAAIEIARADDTQLFAGARAGIVTTTLDDAGTAALAAGWLAARET